MADIRYYDVILKPIVTEKSMKRWARRNILSWFIRKQTKLRSKKAVEKMFEGNRSKRMYVP